MESIVSGNASAIFRYLEDPKFFKRFLLLWQAIYKRYDFVTLIAIFESDGVEMGQEWKVTIYNLLQEALMDDEIMKDMPTFDECEKMVDKGMTLLNLGMMIAPKAIILFRLTLAFIFRMLNEREENFNLSHSDEQGSIDNDLSDQEFDEHGEFLSNAGSVLSGFLMLNPAKWFTQDPLPIYFAESDIAFERDVDLKIVCQLLKYLEEQGLIVVGDLSKESNGEM